MLLWIYFRGPKSTFADLMIGFGRSGGNLSNHKSLNDRQGRNDARTEPDEY